MLENISNTAVLIECGFLSNSEERNKLTNDEYQRKIALNIKKGVVDYFSNGNTIAVSPTFVIVNTYDTNICYIVVNTQYRKGNFYD